MPQTLTLIQPNKIIPLRPTIRLLIKRSGRRALRIRICKSALNGDLTHTCCIRGNLIAKVQIVTIGRYFSGLYDVDANLRRAEPTDGLLMKNGGVSRESENMKREKRKKKGIEGGEGVGEGVGEGEGEGEGGGGFFFTNIAVVAALAMETKIKRNRFGSKI